MNDLRAALYCRLPTPTGNADDLLASLRGVAASRGWHVVASVSGQPTGSASVRSAQPALDAILRGTNFDVLVVPSLSHLARTLPELIKVVNELRSRGTALLACDDGIDTATEAGMSTFTAFAALAEFQHAQIRERSRASLDRARRNGVRLGRPTNVNASVNAAIVALRERGFSIRRIASELRVGNRSVYAALEAARTARGPERPRNPDNGFGTRLRALERVGQEVLA